MCGNNGIDSAGDPSNAGPLYTETQMASSPSCRLSCVHCAESIHDLVHRRVASAARDRLGEHHGGNDRNPPALEQLAEHPPELIIDRRLIDHAGVENDDRIAH